MWSFEVLSPPCGMVTLDRASAIPQVFLCSKPTVWDGDKLRLGETINEINVLSPPCGMVTATLITIFFPAGGF